MNYRSLGRSALKVSELCLGTMNFGPRTASGDAHRILSQAVDAGINFIDTANQYGGSEGVGTTERIIGKWLADNKVRRERLVVATKAYEPMSDDVNDRGLSARHIQRACEDSLRRLGVEQIELYQMHHLDRSAPVEEIWQAMDRLIDQGKILYVGSSNFPGWTIACMNERARIRERLGIVSEQSLYNLIERRAELEVLPACRAYGVGLIPWSPLAGGLLSCTDGSDGRGRRSEAHSAFARHQVQLTEFQALCVDLEEAPSVVALSWLLHQDGVSAVIAGPASGDQLATVLRAPELRLDVATLERIDQIFPPCGEAPEAYAW